jgi:hypothetical protein
VKRKNARQSRACGQKQATTRLGRAIGAKICVDGAFRGFGRPSGVGHARNSSIRLSLTKQELHRISMHEFTSELSMASVQSASV